MHWTVLIVPEDYPVGRLLERTEHSYECYNPPASNSRISNRHKNPSGYPTCPSSSDFSQFGLIVGNHTKKWVGLIKVRCMITTQYWADHIWRAAVWSVGRVIGWSERINSGHSTFLHGCTSTLDKYREWQEITGSGVSCASSPNSLGVAFLVAPFWGPTKTHFETPTFQVMSTLDQVMFSLVKVSSSRQLMRRNPVAFLDYNDAEKVAFTGEGEWRSR